jgi:phosphoribosylformylglycinamidine synthase II/phosphoribosylformylglycinamidine synthase I
VLVLDRQETEQEAWIEIRPRHPRAPSAAAELERLGPRLIEVSRILRIETRGERLEPRHLAELFDSLTEEMWAGEARDAETSVDVFCRAGVTDAEGEMASLALSHTGLSGVTCRAGLRYRFADVVPRQTRPVFERLLGNDLIHRFIWHDEPEIPAGNESGPALEPVQAVAVIDAGDDDLVAISRRFSLALDLEEMRAVATYFRGLQRNPTDVELQSVALAWSEHCSHKTFKATIHFEHEGQIEVIHGLLPEMIAAPAAALNRPWVRSAFVDNAGVIAFDKTRDIAFKVETHNHPSALEPYGGAHTGVGGVIRDVLAVSAEPIGNTDVLCFGPLDLPEDEVPTGTFHPRRTYREVVRGVGDYGNNMGIPTVGGAVLFDRGYAANPLVFCGTLGIAPRGSHPRDPRPGDAIVLLGGRTGRDGLHGATMSSQTLDRATVASSTVQIGAPITEKLLRDVLPRLRDERLYHGITDCGAGGLCSAVGEMGESLGVDVDLACVPLKYRGLLPWEIWLSEAQERMVLAVPEGSLFRLREICKAYDLEATVLGRFRDDGMLRLTYGEVLVAEVHLSFMHGGRPDRILYGRWASLPSPPAPHPEGTRPWERGDALLTLLAHPNIASKEEVIRLYDHEVGAATVIKPLTANGGPSDAAVLRPDARSWRGVAVSHGINPLYGRHDPYAMAMLAVDEALRNLVAVGGSIDRAALLDNFCWGDVDDADELGALVRAAQGCRDASLSYVVPFISGKDSLRNTSVDQDGTISIPGTLLISAISVIPDVRRCITMDLKRPGNRLYALGVSRDELGGSHYLAIRDIGGGTVPQARPREARKLMRSLTRAIRRGLCLSCHDVSEGGLAVTAAEMSLAGRLGLELDVGKLPAETDAAEALLFGESAGRFLAEVAPEREDEFRAVMAGVACECIGEVVDSGRFAIRRDDRVEVDLGIDEIELAWKGGLEQGGKPGSGQPGLPAIARGHESWWDEGVRTLEGNWGDCVMGRVRRGHGGTALHLGALPRSKRSANGRATARVMVLAAAGVNCDRETVEACRLAGADVELVHLNRVLAGEVSMADFGMLIFPGGFSYGDHLGAGAILASVLRHRLLGELDAFVRDGRLVLGICNGFQVIARLGLLGDVSLAANDTGVFECRWTQLRVDARVTSPFLDGLESLPSTGRVFELPIAHGEGRVVAPDDALPELLARAPLRYVRNPNGSVADIAGICNAAGNVLGMMPHPERFVMADLHPGGSSGHTPAGLVIFQNAVRYVSHEL